MFFSADKENKKETTEEVLLKPTKKIESRSVRFGNPDTPNRVLLDWPGGKGRKEKNGEKVAFVGVEPTPSAIRAVVLSQLDKKHQLNLRLASVCIMTDANKSKITQS